MEYRKLIAFGKNSYVISLPKAWIRQNKLQKGDLIYIDENSSSLILQPNQGDTSDDSEIVIPINDKNLKRIQRDIISAYIHNYRTIKLVGSDIKTRAQEIQNFIQKLVALEIIEQDSKKIIAKDFLNIKDISVDQIIKKMDVISRSMLRDCKEMFLEDNYESIHHRDQDINKFRFLLYRIVWYGMENPSFALKNFNLNQKALFNYWWLSFSIEQIGDCIKRVARAMRDIKLSKKDKEEFLALLTKIEENYIGVLKAYYKQDVELANQIVGERARLVTAVEDFFTRNREIHSIGFLTHNTKGLIVNLCAIGRIIYQGMLI